MAASDRAPAASPWSGYRPAVLLIAAVCALAAAGGLMLSWSSNPAYTATATLQIIGVPDPRLDANSVYVYSEAQRFALLQMSTWTEVAQSDVVVDRAAQVLRTDPFTLRDDLLVSELLTTTSIQVEVTGGATPEQARQNVATFTGIAADELMTREMPDGPQLPRIATQVTVSSQVVDAARQDLIWSMVLGSVLAGLLTWIVLAIWRPGSWIRSMPSHATPAERLHRTQDTDQSVQLEVLRILLAGQSRRGLFTAGAALFAVLGYAVTGSPLPLLLVVIAAGVAAVKDLRYAACAILLCGVSALPTAVSIASVGPISPTVLEVAIAIGVVLTVLRWRPERPRGPFTAPMIAILVALVVGCLVGLGRRAEITLVVEAVRYGLLLLAFFVIREAFRGRPHQLLAVLLVNAVAASTLVLLAIPLGLDALLVGERQGVIVGSETLDVPRISPPVLLLWSPVLLILAAGVIRLRVQWLMIVLAILLLGLSFTRSTWVPLIGLVVCMAGLRGGLKAVVVRTAQIGLAGALLFAMAATGLLGPTAEAISVRMASVLNGEIGGETSLSDRVHENQLAIRALEAHPYAGLGVGIPYGPPQESVYDELQDRATAPPTTILHNQYLNIWLQLGVIGLLAYGALAVRIAVYSVHCWLRLGASGALPISAAAGAGLVAVQAVFGTYLYDAAAILTVASIVALAELSATRDPGPPRDPALGPRGPQSALRTDSDRREGRQ